MKNKRIGLIVLIISVVAIIGIALYSFIPRIKVIENRIEYNSYNKPQVIAYNLFNDYTKDLVVTGEVDNTNIGKYNVNYSFKFLGINVSKDVTVSVEDMVAPVLTLNGEEETEVCPLEVYEEEGYLSIDDVDGNITDQVVVNSSKDQIVYTSTDNNNNKTTVTRKLTYVDKTAPVISLNGGESVTIYQGNAYEEKGYTATDKCEGDLTDKVVVSGSVDTSTIGEYQLTYSVSDSNGNEATIIRTVKVSVKQTGSYYGNKDGKIYLTFDDGAGAGTEKILDILAKYNIKATFFVVHPNELTVRAAKEGHAIGLHSATHDYSKIYASVNAYFEDLQTIHDEVYELTGIDSHIIRFPGGSSNTVSKKYCKGIMSTLTQKVLEKGYVYFDWNVDSNDGGGETNHDKLVSNVVDNVSHSKENVILMHDIKSTTANALEDIIVALLNKGYEFATLDENSTMVVQSVNN